MRRKTFFRACLVLLIITMTIGSSAAQTTKHKLRLASGSYEGQAPSVALEEFSKEVFERSDGRVEIKIYPGDQLGHYDKVYSEVIMGSIDMMFGVVGGSYDTRVQLTHFPFLLKNYEEAERLWGYVGEFTNIIRGVTAEKGVKALAAWGQGFGGFSFAKEPKNAVNPEVRKGLKIRVPAGHKFLHETATSLGYDIVALPRGEVEIALQTGVIDGSLGSAPELAYSLERDFISHYVWYHDQYGVWFLLMNMDKYDSLSDQDQIIIEEVAKEKFADSFKVSKETDLESIEKMKEYGIKVIELSEDELEVIFKYARENLWPKFVSEVGEEIYGKVVEITSKQ